jgi:hypothetical protein
MQMNDGLGVRSGLVIKMYLIIVQVTALDE